MLYLKKSTINSDNSERRQPMSRSDEEPRQQGCSSWGKKPREATVFPFDEGTNLAKDGSTERPQQKPLA